MLAGLRKQSFQRGVLGGDRRWLALSAVLWGANALRRATRRETGVIWRGRVEPGESLVVTYHPPRRRGQRRR